MYPRGEEAAAGAAGAAWGCVCAFGPCPCRLDDVVGGIEGNRFGISFILWADVICSLVAFDARKPRVFQPWWSQSDTAVAGIGKRDLECVKNSVSGKLGSIDAVC